MRICQISAELTPFAKTGGLGDVAAALGRYLDRHGHDVRVFVPLYGNLKPSGQTFTAVEFLQDIPIRSGPHTYHVSIFTAPLPGGGPMIYFVGCPALFGRKALYTMDQDEFLRFAILTRAAFEACQRMGFSPHIVHAHDWHAALAPVFLKTLYAWDRLFQGTRSVVTIHNLAYQGGWPARVVHDLGLTEHAHLLHQEHLAGGVLGFLETGLLHADAVTVVSKTYAREVQTPDLGMGLDGLLRARRKSVFGILNGVDYDEWSPENDALIPHRFSPEDLSGKAANKLALLEQAGLPADPHTPVVGVVSRLTSQKGFDLTFDALPEFLRRGALRLVALGSGAESLEGYFRSLAQAFPSHATYVDRFDNPLAHLIEAGSDIFLMPSRFEPCGLNQMYSLKYGTVPIVRKTGGLADTVELYDPDTGRGNGIVFDHYTPVAFAWALRSALDLYQDRDVWLRLMRNGMACDYSWDRQIQEYVALYRSLEYRVR
jgi:starch synthase